MTQGHLLLPLCLCSAGAVYGTYFFTKSHRIKPEPGSGGSGSGDVFDGLAEYYDDAVGTEEWGMGLGVMRSWILRAAKASQPWGGPTPGTGGCRWGGAGGGC